MAEPAGLMGEAAVVNVGLALALESMRCDVG